MRFFLDHCIANSVATALRNAGHEVVHLYQAIPVDAEDHVVIETAQTMDALLVSLNGDFADIVQFDPGNLAGLSRSEWKTGPAAYLS